MNSKEGLVCLVPNVRTRGIPHEVGKQDCKSPQRLEPERKTDSEKLQTSSCIPEDLQIRIEQTGNVLRLFDSGM